MNREEAKKAIKVMQAYVDGRKIEYKMHDSSLGWNPTDEMQGNFSDRDYRVKPTKPRTGRLFSLEVHGVELTNEVKDALEKAGIKL